VPGPFTHIYTARRVADFLGSDATEGFVRASDGPLLPAQTLDGDLLASLGPERCAQAMNDWPKFTALGALGPDLFFFMQDYKQPFVPCDELMLAMSIMYYLDDQGRLDDPYDGLLTILATVSDTWASILRLILKLKQAWDRFLDVWDDTVGPILDKAGQVVDDLTGGLYNQLGDAISQLGKDLVAIAAEELLTAADIFSFFALGMREGLDEKAFLWSDMTHYRRTSQVPRRLVAHARILADSEDQDDRRHADQLLAYALGWVCHVGTDTVAHSFVNEQAGGPFRTHWQRHHLVENHVDAYNYERTGTGELPDDPFVGSIPSYESLNESALYFALQIPQDIDELDPDEQQGDLRRPLPEPDSRAHRKEREELLDTDGELPDWLAETIVRVLIEVYATPEEGGLAEVQEEPTPHPLNLQGEAFQTGLHTSTHLLGKWLDALGIDRSDIALEEFRQQVAPDHEPGYVVPPGFPLPWEVKATYRFMLSWFKRSYQSTLDLDKPKRPTIFTPPSSDYDFGPPDFSGVSSADDPISEACAVIEALLDWIWKTVERAAQLAYDIAKSVISAATWPAREAIYEGLLLPAWQVGENVRMVLAHLGYLMPQSEDRYDDGEIRHPSEIDLELVTLGHTVDGAFAQALAGCFDVLGNLDDDPALLAGTVRNPKSADYPWLPVRKIPRLQAGSVVGGTGTSVVEFRRPWGYPDRNNERADDVAGNYLEPPLTTAGPYPQEARPTVLLGEGGPASNELRVVYQDAGCPEETDQYNARYVGHAPFTNGYGDGGGDDGGNASGTNPLGDPVVFSAYLIGQIADNPRFAANFNLDADRGYGYLCWDWTRNPQDSLKNLRGQSYPPPLVPPEGADDPDKYQDPHLWHPKPPTPVGQQPAPQHDPAMRLRYPGRSCDEGPGEVEGPS
jgi:Zinc dependent phospholipase C